MRANMLKNAPVFLSNVAGFCVGDCFSSPYSIQCFFDAIAYPYSAIVSLYGNKTA
jgi:hypothetical protein